MTEMHTPIRALFVVDAPVSRVEAVLKRRPDLDRLVKNEWVRFIVRDLETNSFLRRNAKATKSVAGVPEGYELVDLPLEVDAKQLIHQSYNRQKMHAISVTKKEKLMLGERRNRKLFCLTHTHTHTHKSYWSASAGSVLACAIPSLLFGQTAMNPYGVLIAFCGTTLVLPILAFARRYLHGEFMFSRFAILSVIMGGGFNLVALAEDLEHALIGWSLFGFASTFLIGAYNDRPTVRNNATYAFAAYQVSDMALLGALAFSQPDLSWFYLQVETEEAMVAGCLMLAALFKSSQLPLTSLFVRSMEGPTPASALGYAVRRGEKKKTCDSKNTTGFICTCWCCSLVLDDAFMDGV